MSKWKEKAIAEKIDYLFNKMLPKKFIVITVATIIVLKSILAPDQYWYLLMLYFGGNVAMKFVPKDNKLD